MCYDYPSLSAVLRHVSLETRASSLAQVQRAKHVGTTLETRWKHAYSTVVAHKCHKSRKIILLDLEGRCFAVHRSQTQTQTHTHRYTHGHTERDRERHIDRQTDRHTSHTHTPALAFAAAFPPFWPVKCFPPPPPPKKRSMREWAWMCVFVRARL